MKVINILDNPQNNCGNIVQFIEHNEIDRRHRNN